ncbi:hypothetical protein GT755_07605 [Herbidospora sp. NEAU-GS84]|uniref:Uncharacterized protein n=1 Tax=Herbidospora solisilvae TaxID=2696284 RepID=A0A7C9MVP2_9ACTN|nr:hypothetical protein [Herbidospora solisilvae]NAS21551.1 hypothetical protein [Herbidospora solisilvae]
MPTTQHDSLNQLFRERPQLALDLVRRAKLLEVPDGLPVRAHQLELSDRVSKELRPDLLLTLGPEREPYAALIVEMQLQPSEAKARQLPRYAAAVWLHLDCPVHVVVVCPDRRTARWAATRMPTELETLYVEPLAIGPDDIPLVTRAQVADNPELATLSLMAHGADPGVAEDILDGFDGLPVEHAAYYYQYAFHFAAESAKHRLEQVVKTKPVFSPFAREHFGEGVAVGETQGEIKSLLTILDARGLTLDDRQRETVTACTDSAQILEWVRRAAVVDEAAELFV